MNSSEGHYSYIICNPHLVAENRLQFILQEAGLGLFHVYTDFCFAQKLLKALEIEAETERFDIIPYRCFYYSDYNLPKYPWQDRWYAIWKATITTKQAISLKTITEEIPVEAFGAEIRNHPTETEPTGCLVIADFELEVDRSKANEAIIKQYYFKQKPIKPFPINTETYSFVKKKKFFQLQIDLGIQDAHFFQMGAIDAQIIIDLCNQYRGKTHYYHLKMSTKRIYKGENSVNEYVKL